MCLDRAVDLGSVCRAATELLENLGGMTLQAVICNAAIAQMARRGR